KPGFDENALPISVVRATCKGASSREEMTEAGSFRRAVADWKLRRRTLELGRRTLVMGVVNLTPDSFSDGGLFFSREGAVARAMQLLDEGADLLDLGAESTRP